MAGWLDHAAQQALRRRATSSPPPLQPITRLHFSSDSRQLAAASEDSHVLLFRLMPWRGSSARWEYMGRHAAHHGPIVGLAFGEAPSGLTKLFSLGGCSTPAAGVRLQAAAC